MMKLHIASIAAAVLLTSGTALAGGGEGLGVGGDIQLNGLVGPSVNYDSRSFHAGGLLALGISRATTIQVGIGGQFGIFIAQRRRTFRSGDNLA